MNTRSRRPPLVSCLLPLSQHGALNRTAIISFLAQDYPERELILIDESSLADPLSLPEGHRIRLLQLPGGMTPTTRLDFAVQHADGEVLCLWSADAWHAPNRITAQLGAQRAKRRGAVVLTSSDHYDARNRRYYRRSPRAHAGTILWRRGADTSRPLQVDAAEYFRSVDLGPPDQTAGPWEPAAPWTVDVSLFHPSPLQPVVSCIMPTFNRPWAVPMAIGYFLAQDYPERELIVVDDGDQSIGHLLPADPRIRYLRLQQRFTVGSKRNIACREARGEFIVHWDDDDWNASWRLSYQVAEMLRTHADVSGTDRFYNWDPLTGEAWRYSSAGVGFLCLTGGTLMYRHSFWQGHPFPEVDVGEDNAFVMNSSQAKIAVLDRQDFYVATIHPGNTSPKLIGPPLWSSIGESEIAGIMGEEAAGRHREAMAGVYAPRQHPPVQYFPPPAPRRQGAAGVAPQFSNAPVPSFTLARADHLNLLEFAAFNDAFHLPFMRRWEMPFALFQARLSDTMAVLDCSINPYDFGAAVRSLYPHINYRHMNPLAGDELALPCFPDASFDRIFCINTLEHLTAMQRSQLAAFCAALLRPRGRFVVTCDQYFPSAFRDPAWAATGLLPREGEEIAGGFNAITPECLISLVAPHALEPLEPAPVLPSEGDSSLYCNPAPLTHTSMGAVFQKRPHSSPLQAGIVLSLLSWNTREVSLESLDALVREAAMLIRLGHDAAICVVDNGSTDGAPQAFQERAVSLDLPHRLILNATNLGNARARNQIIDYATSREADYILFCDGDIELVPFSSFVLLRYMEAGGSRLGCFGAYSFQCTPERERTTPFLFNLAGCTLNASNNLAWTQYGIFRRRMFDEGIRFDVQGPFGEPGHGLEDTDLAFQMNMRDYANHYFEGIWYLHRNLSSSVAILQRDGLDPKHLYYRRRDYFVEKWQGRPGVPEEYLDWVRDMPPPWPDQLLHVETTVGFAPGAPAIPVPGQVMDWVNRCASAMLDSTELIAIAAALAAFPWSGSQIVVEIGAYTGLTTVFMAKVLALLGHKTKILSIDPFERCQPDNFNPQGSYAAYMENILSEGVDDRCMALVAFSQDAVQLVPDNIGVLVVDGWHYYDAVKSDLAGYSPKVVPGGYIFIDDYGYAYPDVIRAVDEFLAVTDEFELLAKRHYVVLRRTAPPISAKGSAKQSRKQPAFRRPRSE
jgi:glycosyltransferase involved in cell wall biosynthesis/predicted O-methyltransferase YrrM